MYQIVPRKKEEFGEFEPQQLIVTNVIEKVVPRRNVIQSVSQLEEEEGEERESLGGRGCLGTMYI